MSVKASRPGGLLWSLGWKMAPHLKASRTMPSRQENDVERKIKDGQYVPQLENNFR